MTKQSTVHQADYDPATRKIVRSQTPVADVARIDSGLYQHLSCAVAHLPTVTQASRRTGLAPGFRPAAQATVHNNLSELRFVESGRGQIELNGQSCDLKPGSLVVLGPGDAHRTLRRCHSRMSVHYYLPPIDQASGDASKDSFLGYLLESFPRAQVVQVDRTGPIAVGLARVSEAYKAGGVGHELLCSLRLVEVLVELARHQNAEQRDLSQAARQRRDHLMVADMQAAIRGRIAEEMSIGALLDAYPLAANYVRDIFKRVSGHSIQDWWRNERVRQAQDLLRDPEWTIAQAGAAVGYQDYHYFLKVFKRQVGQSPGQWRQRHRQA